MPITPSLWWHQTRPLQFSLVLDDFGIQLKTKLISPISYKHKKIYKISEDCEGKLYCGRSLEWNQFKQKVLVSMSNYVTKALHKFQKPIPRKDQYAPHQWKLPQYGATKKLETPLYT